MRKSVICGARDRGGRSWIGGRPGPYRSELPLAGGTMGGRDDALVGVELPVRAGGVY